MVLIIISIIVMIVSVANIVIASVKIDQEKEKRNEKDINSK